MSGSHLHEFVNDDFLQPTLPEKRFSIQIASYGRGRHPVNNHVMPYHWALFLSDGPSHTDHIIYQLKGMPGAFHYDGPEKFDHLSSGLGLKLEEVDVGEVPVQKAKSFEKIIEAVHISKQEFDWNCQNWTLDALERLKDSGYLYDYITTEGIKAWLKEKNV